MELDTRDIAFIVVTVLMSLTAILTNSLLLSVIVAAEKLGSNVANLVFLCVPHLELAVLALVTIYSDYQLHADAKASLPIECLQHGAILWSIGGITSLAMFQYIHIEKPFWFETHVTSKSLVVSSLIGGCIGHLIGLIPLMATDTTNRKLQIGAYALFAALVFLSLIIIIGLSSRMLVLAEQHRRRLRMYTTPVKTSRADSMKFLLILITIYVASNLVPVFIGIAELAQQKKPTMYIRVLHLIAPICYPILYGTRIPRGFLTSLRMTICCCLPVKPIENEPQIEDMVRLTMMRLGNVMIKIDEQAAMKRHSSYLKRRTQIMKSFPFLRHPERDHEAVRPYKSCDATLGRDNKRTENREQAPRAVSLHAASIGKVPRHAKVGRLFSWLPKRSARKLDLTQTEVGNEKKSSSSSIMLTAASGPTRKLSNISEQPDNVEDANGRQKDDENESVDTANVTNVEVVIENGNAANSLEIDNYSTHSTSPCLNRMS